MECPHCKGKLTDIGILLWWCSECDIKFDETVNFRTGEPDVDPTIEEQKKAMAEGSRKRYEFVKAVEAIHPDYKWAGEGTGCSECLRIPCMCFPEYNEMRKRYMG